MPDLIINLLQNGVDIEVIIKSTSLTEQEINELKNGNNIGLS